MCSRSRTAIWSGSTPAAPSCWRSTLLALEAAGAPVAARGSGDRRGHQSGAAARAFDILLAVTIAVAMKIVGILLVMAFLDRAGRCGPALATRRSAWRFIAAASRSSA